LLFLLVSGFAANWSWATLNNGFETDYLYAVQTAWKDDKPDCGDVLVFNENTGAYVGKLVDFVKDPDPAKQDWGWEMLTFAYDSGGNARLFVVRRMDRNTAEPVPTETYRDIEIAEFNASGGLVRKTTLGDILGVPHVGERVRVGAIGFSTYPGHADSLFIPTLAKAPAYQPCKVYEVNLGLTAVKNIYSGPIASDHAPRVGFNPGTGQMYVVAGAMGEPSNRSLGRSDLVMFEYASPGTNPSTYATLVNGKIMARRDDFDGDTDPGFPKPREKISIWHTVQAVIYRGTDHEDGRETLVLPCAWHWDTTKMPCHEFYLDQADSQGNLVRRGTFYNCNYYVSSGQLDRVTGSIWLARLYGYNSNNGFIRYDRNDNAVNTGIGANRGFSDVCSPGLAPMGAGWATNNGSVLVNGNASVQISQMPGPRIGFEDHPNIHANSYHLSVNEAWANELDPVVAQGQAEGKPVIISDDNGSSANVTRVQEAIARTTSVLGEHYEHYDIHLGGDATHDGAHFGKFISSAADFPAESKTILATLGTYASDLAPGGKLTVSGHEFLWNGQPVTLAGSSWYGALVATMCDVDGYLDVLASYGANFTRVWCIEQWTGTANAAPGFERVAWLPYEGYKVPNTSLSPPETKWDLYTLNAQYFARVKEFVRKAAARGIVVQLTLFDRFGVQCSGGVGGYLDSPYYDVNNLATINFLTCSGGSLPFLDLAPAPIWDVNRAFIERMLAEVGSYGNVLYEIMNEPHNQWPNAAIVNWHKAVADTVVASTGGPVGLQASVDLGDPDVNEGISLITVGDGDTTAVTMAGRSCRTNTDPAGDRHFYFQLDSSLSGSKPELFITVDYCDVGNGSLILQYDSTDSAPFPDDIYKNGGALALSGTDSWKTHTFHVTDARFAHRQNGGADFRIVQPEEAPFYLDIVSVRDLGIIQQPISLICRQGDTAEFSIVAGGGGVITYQWQRNGVDLADGGSVSGATSPTLRISNVSQQDEGSYRCLIANGTDPIVSAEASLTVAAPGDFDIDDDVDIEDFAFLQLCCSGLAALSAGCEPADLYPDGAVNTSDVDVFLSCLGGANRPPTCP
jgi:hypothetical protein